MRPRLPRDPTLRLDPCSTANRRDDAVVAAAEPAPRVSANVIPDADHVPIPPDDPDDCCGGADHARRIGALHVLRERSSSAWLHSDGRSSAGRADHVDRSGHLYHVRFHGNLCPMVADRGPGDAADQPRRSGAASRPARPLPPPLSFSSSPYSNRRKCPTLLTSTLVGAKLHNKVPGEASK